MEDLEKIPATLGEKNHAAYNWGEKIMQRERSKKFLYYGEKIYCLFAHAKTESSNLPSSPLPQKSNGLPLTLALRMQVLI